MLEVGSYVGAFLSASRTVGFSAEGVDVNANTNRLTHALGDLPHGSVGYQTIFAAGLTLMLVTLVFNLLGYWLRRRYREAY